MENPQVRPLAIAFTTHVREEAERRNQKSVRRIKVGHSAHTTSAARPHCVHFPAEPGIASDVL
jgi:hypothetical protein